MSDSEHVATPDVNAEEWIRTWALSLEVDELLAGEAGVSQVEEGVNPYIAISCEAGASGSVVARRASEMLGWQLINRELLVCLAERYKLPRDMVDVLDQKTSHWLVEGLRMWMGTRLLSETDYVMQVARFVLMAARHAPAVFVGRGSQFILPRAKGLAVLIVAPLDQRIERIMQGHSLSRAKAKRYAAARDAGRRDYLKKYFHRQPLDPHLYDLVINTERIDPERAAEIIVNESRLRHPVEPAPLSGSSAVATGRPG